VNSLEKEHDNVTRNEEKLRNATVLNHSALLKVNKDQLVNLVTTFSNMTKKDIEFGKSAAGTIDDLKTELPVNKQKDLISVQKEQLGKVRDEKYLD
jgi:hypothetical protein